VNHALGQRWAARSARERRVIVAVTCALTLVLYAWLLRSTTQARQQLLPAVTELQAQALRQGAQADEIVRLRALPPPPPASGTDLRPLVQRQVDAAGLGRALVSMELVDARHVKLVFGNVGFADWLAWADAMQARHLRFAAVRVEAQSAPGQVSVTATLERPGR
jgi:type II secretory pathway component PulM